MRLAQLTTLFLLGSASIAFADEPFQVSVSRSVAHPVQRDIRQRLSEQFAADAIVLVPAADGFKLGTVPTKTILEEQGAVTAHLRLDVTRKGDLIGGAIFDPATGDMLVAFDLPPGVPEESIRLIAVAVRQARAKIGGEAKGPQRVALAAIDVAGLPLEWHLSAPALVELLSRHLASAEKIVVATRDAPDAHLLRVEVAMKDDARLVVKLKLRDESWQTETDRLDAAVLTKLSSQVCEGLDVAPPTNLPSAARHTAMADDLWAQNEKQAAISEALKAALLAPDDIAIQRRLTRWLLTEVESYPQEWKPVEQRQLLALAMRTELQIVNALKLDDVEGLANELRYPDAVYRAHSIMNTIDRLDEQFAPGDLVRLRAAQYRCITRPIHLYHQAAEGDHNLLPTYSLALGFRMHYLCHVVPDDESPVGQAAIDAAMRWLKLFDTLPVGKKPWNHLNIVLRDLTKNSQVRDRALMEPFYRRLEENSEPLVRLLGMRGRLTHDWSTRDDVDERAEKFAALSSEALEILDAARKAGRGAVADEALRFLDESYNSLRLSNSTKIIDQMLDTSDELMQRGIPPGRTLLDACLLAEESSSKRAYELLTNLKKLRGGDSDAAMTEVFARLEAKWPQLRKAPMERPVELKKLFDASEFGDRPLVLHPIVHSERVYFVVLRAVEDTSVVQFVGVPIAGGEHEVLGKFTLPERFASVHEGEHTFVTATCTDRDACYVAIRGVGIVEFGLREERQSIMVRGEWLPDGVVGSLAIAGGQLYVGMHGGKLLCANMMTGRADTLASTDVKVVKTSLDDRPPFDIPIMLADDDRDRLLVIVQDRHEQGRGAEIWQLATKTQELGRLQKLGRIQLGLTARLHDDVLTLSDTWFLRWNLKSGEKIAVANYDLGDIPPTRRLWVGGLRGAVYCGDTFWWMKQDGSLGRMVFPDGKAEFYVLDELRDAAKGNYAASCAIPVDDKRFVLHHSGKLWLATPTP
jgi:hypothetical protein